jgi:hypothetical protein
MDFPSTRYSHATQQPKSVQQSRSVVETFENGERERKTGKGLYE